MDTNNKRFQRLNELLAKVLEQPEQTRDDWIDEQCADDLAMAAELRELLKYDAEETGRLAASIEATSVRATASIVGDSIGSYRITEKIAEGGMGVVYAGEREGTDFEHRVAIKIMHSHKFDELAQARFVAERQILATLNHPNIARLIDGGMTEDGLPYIVMEYIDGENIADYCARKQLDNASILRLVMDVCGALQYAHNQLVIHRDIKPSNILVDASGAPRLLDFGIAKLLQQDSSQAEQTQIESRVMTPLYASPEQLGTQPVSTAADVYGIGLLLYRLLTGRLPYTPTSDHPRDIENAILSMPAEAPSRAVTHTDRQAADNPQHLNRNTAQWTTRQKKALRGDLDTILLKALRKEPERRYATVNAFREDLERYLGQLPIKARRDTFGYRASRFIARNKTPVSLAALLVITTIGLTAFYTARLNTERETAQQTADFLTDMFEATDPARRSRVELTVADLVSTGADKVAEDKTLAPPVRARLLHTISRVLSNVREHERAETLLVEALSIYEEIDAPEDHVRALQYLAILRRFQGRYEDGLEILDEARMIAEKSQGPRSLAVANIACNAAGSHYRTGNYEAMYEDAQLALTLYQELSSDDFHHLSCAYGSLGLYHMATGDPRAGIEYYERNIELVAQHLGPKEASLAGELQSISIAHIDLGEYRAAAEKAKRAIDIRLSPSGGAQQYTFAMYSQAHATGKLGRFGEAHQLFKDLIALQIERTGDSHDHLAYWLNSHGDMLAHIGATDLANEAFQRVMEIYTQNDKPADHLDRSFMLIGLGKVARDRNNLEEAEKLMRQGLAIRIATISEKHSNTQLARVDLAEVLRRQDRIADARSSLDTAIKSLRDSGNENHPVTAQALTVYAQIELAEGQLKAATRHLEQAISITKDSLGLEHLDNVDRRLLLAEVLQRQGDEEASSNLRAEALAVRADIMANWNKMLERE